MEMDHKAWLWRKKSTEKPNVAAAAASDKVNVKENEEEVEALLAEKAEMENNLKTLSNKLASALSERNSKDELVKKHAKMAQEAVHGWEKVETEAGFLKKELDKAFHLRTAGEERIAQLDAALKECMQQLRFVREEQEQRVHDAVMKTSREFQKTQMVLEEKLAETTKRISKVSAENTQLSNALLVKEKLIEDLRKKMTQVESDINALTARLGSTEKDNTSLKYEVRVLEKELEIRNEEREFTRRTADQAHKQHLEGAKKIAKLESECQRLRILVRKRLPGPAALAKMKNEVEMLGWDSAGVRRRSLSPNCLIHDSTLDNIPETPTKRINALTEQLCAMEEENQNLKEALNKKMNELQFSRNMYARAVSKLSQVEVPFEESSRGQTTMGPMRISLMSRKLSVASMSDIGREDKVSCSDSWASALITELEHFRNEKQKGSPTIKTVGASDINLMDDFVEMEKLAVVSADQISLGSHVSSPANALVGPMEAECSSELGGSEIVPVSDTESSFCLSNRHTRTNGIVDGNASDWLQDIVQLVLEHDRAAGRNPEQILEDIRIALASIETRRPGELVGARKNSSHFKASNPSSVKSCISWKGSDRSLVTDSLSVVSDVDISSPKKSNPQFHPDLSRSLCKVIELIEGISVPSSDYSPEYGSSIDGNLPSYKNSESHTGYMVRTFQWKTSELSDHLQQFVHACYEVLNGKSGLDKFTEELTTALDWILNHCFSLQDVSSMKDEIKKQFDWDDTRSESEAEFGMVGHFSYTDRLCAPGIQFSCMPVAASSNGHSMEELHANLVKENRRVKDELVNIESAKRELERRLVSADDKSEYLMNQLKESEKAIASLRTELQSLRESKGIIEDQITNQEMMKEDLDKQLTAAKIELSDGQQKISSLEVELENKYNCCEELEAACLELQLQLESVKKKSQNSSPNQEERQSRSDWEITAASEKLAECQETIFNLGKQLKAMAAPREAALFNKVITNPTGINTPTADATDTMPRKSLNQRSSLLDKMLAEDGAAAKDFMSPKTKEVDSYSSSTFGTQRVIEPLENILLLSRKYQDDQDDNASVGSLAIVPGKKRGGGSLWRRLLWRKKKGNSKQGPPSITS